MGKVFEEYKTVSGKDISESIKRETSGLFQESLLAIGMNITVTYLHFAENCVENLCRG